MLNSKLILVTLLVLFSLMEIKSMSGASPIQIKNCDELSNIRNNLSGDYQLATNISCHSHGNFDPMGNETAPFTGIFDGQGFYIYDLKIHTSEKLAGLFTYASGATFRNLNFDNVVVISSQSNAGVILGHGDNVNIQRCFVGFFEENKVSGGYDVGGIVGALYRSRISDCVVTRTYVQGLNNAGGVAGSVGKNSYITRCFNKGFPNKPNKLAVSGSEFAFATCGGVCGELRNSSMSKCGMERGTVRSRYSGGGVVGFVYDGSNIDQIYSLEEVQIDCSKDKDAGGVVGSLLLENDSVFSNAISRTSSASSPSRTGGLIGSIIYYGDNNTLTIENCVSSTHVIGEEMTEGDVIGLIAGYDGPTVITKNVLFDNSKNDPSIKAIGDFYPKSLAESLKGMPIEGLSPQKLKELVEKTFDQSIWDGENLRISNNLPTPFPPRN